MSDGRSAVKVTPKMLQAREELLRRFPGGPDRSCVVKLDMVRYKTKKNPIPAFKQLPGFRFLWDKPLWRKEPGAFQGFGHAHWFERIGSEMKFCVESEPRESWLAPYHVSVFADDRLGLSTSDLFPIREIMEKAKLTIVELAIDFSTATEVDRQFVRRYGVFGKSKREVPSTNPDVDRWGAKGSGKRVKSYSKHVIAAHRVEFRMRGRFLRPHGIRDLFDLWKFVGLLPEHHVLFAQIDEQKLIAHLRKVRRLKEVLGILKNVIHLEGDLTAQLSFLRRNVGLKNARRFLSPLPVNHDIHEAFKAWRGLWRTKPTRLRKKK